MSTTPEKIVGITGPSCSGKTTLEKGLKQRAGDRLTFFPFDDMFVGTKALEGVVVDDWESPSLYRWDDFASSLRDLKNGHSVTIAAHSRESMEAGIDTKTIEPSSLLVVAGFLALHDEEVRALYDDTIYIDLPEDEIIRRRKDRAEPNSPWDTDDYINNGLIPGHRNFVLPQRALANHILDGTLSREALADEVFSIINT